MSQLEIVACTDQDAVEWEAFVSRWPSASCYHRWVWRGINAEVLGHRTHYLAAREGGRIVGVFPIVQVKSRLFGNLACSLPFVNYGGPCAERPDVEAALLERAERLCDTLRVKYLEIRTRHYLGDRWPSTQNKISLTVDLSPDPDVLWNAYKSGHRQQIRKAYKNNLTVKFGRAELLDPFFEVMSESWRNLGTPLYAKSYFASVARALGNDCRVAVVFAGDEPAAAAFDGMHGETVEGMWLGLTSKHRDLYVGYVLYWELIKNACETGFKRFHLGRSTADSGGDSFKRKWNASVTQLYWHYVLRGGRALPGLNVDNPRYQLAMSAWRRLPLGVTQVVGPAIARNIP